MHSRRLLRLGLVFLVAVNLIHATTYEVAQPVAGPISITAGRANWALSWRCRPEPRCLLGQISCWCCNWPPARMRAAWQRWLWTTAWRHCRWRTRRRNALAANYVSGAVTLPPQPTLTTAVTGAGLQLTWAVSTGTFQVQSANSPLGP